LGGAAAVTVSLLHAFVNPASNLPGFTGTKPGDWNAQHNLTGANNSLLGFSGAGASVDSLLFWAAGTLIGGTGAASTLTLESTSGAGTTDNILFKTGSQLERMRVDTSGNVNIGNNGAIIADVFGNNPQMQVSGLNGHMDLRGYTADATGTYITFSKSRSGTIGTNTGLSQSDVIGFIDFDGYDATGTPVIRESSYIKAVVDAAPTAGSVAGRLIFATTASGNATSTEVLRLDGSQRVNIGGPNQNGAAFEINGVGTTLATRFHNTNWNSGAAQFFLGRSNSGILGTQTAVASGNTLMQFTAMGSDGTSLVGSAFFQVQVDAAVSTGIVPGRFMFNTYDQTGVNTERLRIDSNGIKSFTHGAAGYGLAGAGDGGTVTQATSKATGVTLSTTTGQITMNAAALAANTTVSFVLTNVLVGTGDIIMLQHTSAGTQGAYTLDAFPAAGSATISVRNVTAGSLSEAIVLTFAIFKCVTT
jgi:hypothetical protein